MKVRAYSVIELCVENGLKLGYNRAHKHTDNPTEQVLQVTMYDAIMAELHNYFSFTDED